MKQFKIAVVGCGVLGTRHATNAAAHPESTVAYTFDTNPDQSKALAEKVGAEAVLVQREMDILLLG